MLSDRLIVFMGIALALAGCQNDFATKPYVQNPGQDRMTVMWSSRQPCSFSVRYGKGEKPAEKIDVEPRDVADIPEFLYRADLTGLEPGTEYRYTVSSSRSRAAGSFRTVPKGEGPFTFIAYGDSRTQAEIHRAIASRFLEHKPAFILHTGDIVTSGPFEQWQPEFFGPLEEVMRGVPLWPARGNHDGWSVYRQVFAFPGGQSHYSFDYSNAHFVALDMRLSKEVLEWLDRDLAAAKATWKFVFYHYPTFDVGAHRSAWGRGSLLPILRKHRVDFSFAGHSHGYQRFKPMFREGENEKHPITFIVTAGGGAPLHRVEFDVHTAASHHRYHYTVFHVDGDTLSMKALARDGEELDLLTLTKKNGQVDDAYLAEAMPENTFGRLRGAIAPHFGGMVFPELLTPEKTTPLTFRLSAGEYGMTFRLHLEERAAKHYEMTPVEGKVGPGETKDVTIGVRPLEDTARPGTLNPILRLKLEYDIDGKKGRIYSGRLRCPVPEEAGE